MLDIVKGRVCVEESVLIAVRDEAARLLARLLIREAQPSRVDGWYEQHPTCPACALFRESPCKVEYATFNAFREANRHASGIWPPANAEDAVALALGTCAIDCE